MRALVAYFSAESGKTAGLAKYLASTIKADLFEIKPEKVYSSADLNWMNPLSRCNREHLMKKRVPFVGKVESFDQYDTVLIGFPIWYGCAPSIVNTFCSAYDFTGKKVALFATSGGSGIGKTAEKLRPFVKGTNIVDANMFNGSDAASIVAWAVCL